MDLHVIWIALFVSGIVKDEPEKREGISGVTIYLGLCQKEEQEAKHQVFNHE